ncbi:MAG: hypothetical protein KC435_12725 [Thermomicrobiales bacterium]|nr:hypothetical protein [Thermomicrobiales bacterium]
MSRAEEIIQGVLNRVPGYRGYADKEARRDEDKRVRDSVADAIAAVVDQLTAYSAQLAAARDFDQIRQVESEIGQVRTLADRIRHASYGYGGLFGETSIDAAAIEQLRLFDSALLREVDGLRSAATTLTSTTPATAEALLAVSNERLRLTTLFDGRSQVVEFGRPSEDEATLNLLAIPEKIEPSPLLEARKGDALSVLGDNYIANGVVTLSTASGQIILLRVTTESDGATWLIGSDIAGIASAKVTESGANAAVAAELASASANIDTEQGKRSDVAARYAYTNLGDNRVEFTLALGDTIVSFTGETVNDKDIEVYSAR